MRYITSLLLLLLLAAVPVKAQQADSLLLTYSVRYINDHQLRRQGDNFNVVDTQIEWPDVLDHTSTEPLKTYISRLLWKKEGSDLDACYAQFLADKGEQVTAQLDILPDDDHFCYFDIKATIVSYEPQRWIVYTISYDVTPQKASPYKKEHNERTVVYDLAGEQVYSVNELLKLPELGDLEASYKVIDALLDPLSDEQFGQLKLIAFTKAWPINGGKHMAIGVKCTLNDASEAEYEMPIDYETLRYYVKKEARQMIEKTAKKTSLHFEPVPTTWRGDSIYTKVDTAPAIEGDANGLYRQIASLINVAQPLKGRAVLTYVVDTQGRIQDLRVIKSFNPDTDRQIARIVQGVAQYQPATLGGKAVNARVTLPLQLRFE